MGDRSDNRIYIGNLPPDIRNKDLEDIFYKYGKIRYIDLKNKRGPPFAFIEFDDPLDAEDSIKGRDGYNFDGYKLRVEIQKGPRNSAAAPRSFGQRGGPPSRRSDYRVLISGLPPTGSWQDIKDHMRVAGNVCYADVFKDGTGVCEFIRYDDMNYAVKKLDDSKFRSHEGETSYISVKSDYSRSRRSASRSHSRSRSRSNSSPRRQRHRGSGNRERASPSYSPVRRSRSRSRSYDDRRHAKKSYSRSRSRSISPSYRRSSRRTNKSMSRSRSRSRSYSPKRRRSNTRSRSRSHSPVVDNRLSEPKNGLNDDDEPTNGMAEDQNGSNNE